MELKELQDLIKREGGKVIIIEDGEPLFVVIPYEEYARKQKNTEVSKEEPSEDELTIDDLPV